MDLGDIRNAIRTGRVRITDHAFEEAEADRLSFGEIYSSTLRGEVIEEYPGDRPYPSCLIYGRTPAGENVHSVWAHNRDNGWAVLITVYRPDPNRWIGGRQRRRRDDAL